jgi:hypothetical protein
MMSQSWIGHGIDKMMLRNEDGVRIQVYKLACSRRHGFWKAKLVRSKLNESEMLTVWTQVGARVRVINKACLFVLLVNIDNIRTLRRPVASTNWFHKLLGLLNDSVELDLCKLACWRGLIAGALTPSCVAETCLAHGLLAARQIDCLREINCLASGSTGHRNCQYAQQRELVPSPPNTS